MATKFPGFAIGEWIRTCQECGHKQSMKSPAVQKTDNWRNAKCRKCKSEALDYGQANIDVNESEN